MTAFAAVTAACLATSLTPMTISDLRIAATRSGGTLKCPTCTAIASGKSDTAFAAAAASNENAIIYLIIALANIRCASPARAPKAAVAPIPSAVKTTVRIIPGAAYENVQGFVRSHRQDGVNATAMAALRIRSIVALTGTGTAACDYGNRRHSSWHDERLLRTRVVKRLVVLIRIGAHVCCARRADRRLRSAATREQYRSGHATSERVLASV